jgi:hypothetical protein
MRLSGNVKQFQYDKTELGEDIYTQYITHPDTQLYGTDAAGKGGYYKYVNPTQKYTRLFINDEDDVQVALKVPRLSAHCFSKPDQFFRTVVNNLLYDKRFEVYNTAGINNSWMLTRFDYLGLVPDELNMGIDELTPLSQFIFDTVVKNLCRWNLVIGLEDNMNFMKINTNLYNTYKHEKYYPQTMYATNAKYNGIQTTSSGTITSFNAKENVKKITEEWYVMSTEFIDYKPFSIEKKTNSTSNYYATHGCGGLQSIAIKYPG